MTAQQALVGAVVHLAAGPQLVEDPVSAQLAAYGGLQQELVAALPALHIARRSS